MRTSRIFGIAMAAGAAFMLAGIAQADVKLYAARVGGPDVVALAKFYESAFGLKEVRRLQFPGVLEIMLNFGDTEAAAKANQDALIVIMRRAKALKDPVPHLIFYVSDANAAAAAVKAAGGSMRGNPRRFAKTGDVIAVGIDPAGNLIEMIQPAKH